MGTDERQAWNELYSAAILETDADKILERIHLAEQVIPELLAQLEQKGGDPGEKHLLLDSLRTLSHLRRLGPRENPSPPR